MVRGEVVKVRVKRDQRRRWVEAAKRQGYPSLSEWLRYQGDRAARMG